MPPRLRVIINADDFGMDADTCRHTIACFQRGVLSSASIMPTMPAAHLACEFARLHNEFSYGVHLTFVRDTCEAPASPVALIGTLVDGSGRFRGSNAVRRRALTRRIDEEHVATEIEAQLARVRDFGVSISHVDSHGHLHKFPVFQRALERALRRFRVCCVRNQQNVYMRRAWRSPAYWLGKTWRPIANGPWHTTDWFFMPAGENVPCWPERLLASPLSGTLEVGVHPGGAEYWRASERDEACRLAHLMKERRIPMIPWHAL